MGAGSRTGAFVSGNSTASHVALHAAMGEDFIFDGEDCLPRPRRAWPAVQGLGAHLAGGLLRGAAGRTWSRAYSCTSRIFRIMDWDDGGTIAGRGIQPDAPRLGFAAARGLSRREARMLHFLPDCVGI